MGTNVETSQYQRLATPNLARLTANWDNGMDGNAATSSEIVRALEQRSDHPSELVREHVAWALEQHA